MVEDVFKFLLEKVNDPALSKSLERDRNFPRGPAGRSVVLTHMENSGYSAEHIAEAKEILESAGVK